MFWQIVLGSLAEQHDYLTCAISHIEWERHYATIYQNTLNCLAPNTQLSPDAPEWQPVTLEEIIYLIADLKSDPDLIPPNLLKFNPYLWGPILAALFTFINSSGMIPAI